MTHDLFATPEQFHFEGSEGPGLGFEEPQGATALELELGKRKRKPSWTTLW